MRVSKLASLFVIISQDLLGYIYSESPSKADDNFSLCLHFGNISCVVFSLCSLLDMAYFYDR